MLFKSQDYEYVINTITDRILPALNTFTPAQLICGQVPHPRLLGHTVPPPPHMRSHSVNTFFEFCYVLQGSMVVTLDKKSYLIRKNDLCLVKPFTDHYESCNRDREPFEALWGIERGIKRAALIIDQFTAGHTYAVIHRTGARNIREEHKMVSQIYDYSSNASYHLIAIRLLVNRLFHSYLVRLKREMRIWDKNRILHHKKEHEIEKMARVMTYLSDHYKENISIKQLAGDFSLSIDQFEKLYRKIHGESVKQTLIRIRIEQALAKMKDRSLSITEICEQVGYENPLYFSRLFKSYCGYSPTAYIKKYLPV